LLRVSARSPTTPIAALKRGQKAIVTCRGDAESRLKDLTAKGAAALSLDVTDSPAALAKTVKEAYEIYGRLDVLVNNAGAAYRCTFVRTLC
jgi:NAD(P)-dependent dehydrogenase (short-subunit alcohol dehydrogenase family)